MKSEMHQEPSEYTRKTNVKFASNLQTDFM